MRRALSVLITAALMVIALSVPAHAETPEYFSGDWDDPRTAVKPVPRPDTESCRVGLLEHDFSESAKAKGTFTPPQGCGKRWSTVVLTMKGNVGGAHNERLGELRIGGVPVFKTTTPLPAGNGTSWTVERDLAEYSALLRDPHQFTMRFSHALRESGNLDVTLDLTFYRTAETSRPAKEADEIRGLENADTEGGDLNGEVSLPRDSRRLQAEVYATPPQDGCEPDWYQSGHPEDHADCRAAHGPYREVQILIDGQVAGIAAPYPQMYETGWSNQYLWNPLAAPRTFDLRPMSYDLTPYLGLLGDGKSHEVSVRVTGAPDGGAWSTPVAFKVWKDPNKKVVSGGVLDSKLSSLEEDHSENATTATRSHIATGWLKTSSGTEMTTVDRTVSLQGEQTFGSQGTPASIDATWNDVETRSVSNDTDALDSHTTARTYTMDAHNTTHDGRLKSKVNLSRTVEESTHTSGHETGRRAVHESYAGKASFLPGGSQSQQQATAATTSRYRLSGDQACYDRTIGSRNGRVVTDEEGCRGSGTAPREE